MYNAQKYGYTFKILRGYLFERKKERYINTLYKLKASVDKNHPMYLISKLLMNSLYGRFGLDYELPTHYILDDDELESVNDNKKYELSNILELSNG